MVRSLLTCGLFILCFDSQLRRPCFHPGSLSYIHCVVTSWFVENKIIYWLTCIIITIWYFRFSDWLHRWRCSAAYVKTNITTNSWPHFLIESWLTICKPGNELLLKLQGSCTGFGLNAEHRQIHHAFSFLSVLILRFNSNIYSNVRHLCKYLYSSLCMWLYRWTVVNDLHVVIGRGSQIFFIRYWFMWLYILFLIYISEKVFSFFK